MAKVYDVIVVGAGIEGSATAYHLAKQGQETLLLEQFPLPHSRGSSHGQSRITRRAYGEDDFYTEMMKESYRLVDQLQSDYGQQLFKNCGCLIIGPRGNPCLEGSKSALVRHDVEHETFGVSEMKKRYPGLGFPSDYEFILDKSGGILMADKMLKAFQSEFVRHGGVLKDGEAMLDVHPGNIVGIKTTKGLHKCKSLVLALGPWASKFLPRLGLSLPLEPVRISVCYWKEKVPGQFSSESFPCFLEHGRGTGHSFDVYGLPSEEYPGLAKVCLHSGPSIDPDQRDKEDNSWVLERVTKYIVDYFPGLETKPSVVESCIYTNTPDFNPILDVHPAWKNIVIAAGFSGHGFKLAPVVGKLLGELAMGKTPSYDMTPFKIERFFKHKL